MKTASAAALAACCVLAALYTERTGPGPDRTGTARTVRSNGESIDQVAQRLGLLGDPADDLGRLSRTA